MPIDTDMTDGKPVPSSSLGIDARVLGVVPLQAPAMIETLIGQDEKGQQTPLTAVREVPLTLFLNDREVVTMMTINALPKQLALGYLLNQNLLDGVREVTAIDFEEDIQTVVVRTAKPTPFEDTLRRRTLTSGCAQGTLFGDQVEALADLRLPSGGLVQATWLASLSKAINRIDCLYHQVGAIHGCVLCCQDQPLIYVEDIGRHNAVDKIAGHMALENLMPENKIFYTTGRLTSEMVMKAVKMQIPVLVSRSGYTAYAVTLARQANLTMIARLRGRRFTVLSGFKRMVFDS